MAELFIFSGKGNLFSSWEISEILSQRVLHLEEPASPLWPEEQESVLYGEEEGTEPSGGNPGCGPNCVPGFICMASFTRALRRMGLIWEGRVPFHREENFNTERLGNLSKATQPVRDMDRI